jgi:hypothetical protein
MEKIESTQRRKTMSDHETSDNAMNHRENGVRKLADPAGQSGQEAGFGEEGYREAHATRPDSNADLISKDMADENLSVLGEDPERVEDGLDAQIDMTNHDAVREANRLGGTDTYLVDADMEDIDQRQGEDGEDGRPSPMANADNPER